VAVAYLLLNEQAIIDECRHAAAGQSLPLLHIARAIASLSALLPRVRPFSRSVRPGASTAGAVLLLRPRSATAYTPCRSTTQDARITIKLLHIDC